MASTKLTRTFGSGGNRVKWTWSGWIKRTKIGVEQIIFCAYENSNNQTQCKFDSSDQLYFNDESSGNTNGRIVSNAKYRDTNAWYHMVFVFDKNNSTSGDRIKMYVNGERVTSFSDTGNAPFDTSAMNNDSLGREHEIGCKNSSDFFDGVMSHIHFCDGYAYLPSDFGETDSTTGEWKIKTSPNVSYGTTGYWILKDGNSVTDSSPNSNAWTVGGGTLTLTQDNPSNNFATFDTLRHSGSDYSFGSTHCLTVSGTYASRPTYSSLGMQSGKYYAEIKVPAPNSGSPQHALVGITGRNVPNITGSEQYIHLGSQSQDYALHSYNGNMMNNTGSSNNGATYAATYTTDDIIGIAVDLDNNKLYFSKNGVWANGSGGYGSSTFDAAVGVITIAAPTTTQERFYFFAVDAYHYTPRYNYAANFGNGFFDSTAITSAGTNASGIGIFEYDVPTGFTALSTKGLNE